MKDIIQGTSQLGDSPEQTKKQKSPPKGQAGLLFRKILIVLFSGQALGLNSLKVKL